MPFPPGENGITGGVDPSLFLRLQYIPQTAGGNSPGHIHLTRFQEGGSQVGQANKIMYHAPAFDTRSGNCQANPGAKIIEIAFAVRKARRSMITAHHDDRVLVFAHLAQFLDQDSQAGVEGGDLTKIIGQVLPHFVDVGQECRHLALEVVGVDAPKLLARPLDPFAVNVGGTKPIGEGLVLLSSVEERFEVLARFPVKLLLGLINRHSLGHPARNVLGKPPEFLPRFLVGMGPAAVTSVSGRTR